MMDRSDVIFLISQEQEQNSEGVWRPKHFSRRKVFARVLAMNRADWHAAGRDGLNPGLEFLVFAPEYYGEEVVEYKGEPYYIYRTHEGRNPDELELYTSRRQGKRGGVE